MYFGLNDTNKSHLHAYRNEKQLELGECLLPFVQNILSYLLSKNMKIRIYKIIIVLVFI